MDGKQIRRMIQSRKKGEKEECGSANNQGFLRDDNSLIKGIVDSFAVQSSKVKSYNGLKRGRGFVASHIWRIVRIRNNVLISTLYLALVAILTVSFAMIKRKTRRRTKQS